MIVEEGWPHGGVGANLAALIQEQAFDYLDAPVQRVTGADVPMPYSKRLEQAAIPHAEHVVSAALATLEGATVMATDVVMPRLSDSMEEGTILRWLKSPGDEVALGDELVEIETDKANMVYEADAAGTLIEIIAEEGDTLPIGEVIARVGEPGEAGRRRRGGRETEAPGARKAPERRKPKGGAGAQAERAGRDGSRPTAASGAAPARSPQAEPSGDGRVKASPLARRIASENGLELAAIAGSDRAGGSSRRTSSGRCAAGASSRGARCRAARRPSRRPARASGPRPPRARSRPTS